MSVERNKAAVRRAIDEVFNRRHYDEVKGLVAAEFRSHNPQVSPGPEGLKAFAKRLVDGFADFNGEVQEVLAEGDKVMALTRWRGTHTGTFAGVAPTGNKVEFTTVDIFRIADGKLIEHWDVADRLALQTALGLVRPTK